MREGSSEELLKESLSNKERIFPILNKIDKIWNLKPEWQFLELIRWLKPIDKNVNDLEFTKYLDDFYDKLRKEK